MPNRIIREGILTSERVNQLSAEEEVFYRRLLSVVDDYGRCQAHTALLRASLFPLKLDQVTELAIEAMLARVAEVGLIRLYDVGGKRYLEVHNFRQQARSESKHPPPPAGQALSTCAADAQQPPAGAPQPRANAHLGVFVSGGVSGGEGEDVSEGGSRSRARAGEGLTIEEAGPELGQRMLRLNELFNRRPTTRWSKEELTALKAAGLAQMPSAQFEAEASVMIAFYAAPIPEAMARKFWRRTELVRVLRHWPGELDRAHGWAAYQEKIAKSRGEGRL